jgi:hypothetical protein
MRRVYIEGKNLENVSRVNFLTKLRIIGCYRMLEGTASEVRDLLRGLLSGLLVYTLQFMGEQPVSNTNGMDGPFLISHRPTVVVRCAVEPSERCSVFV